MKLDMEDAEVKAAVQAAIDEAIKGLKAKNAELVRKLDAAKEIKPEDYQKALEERDAAQAKLEELSGEAKTLRAANKTLTTQLETEVRTAESMLIETALSQAFVKANVRPEFYKPLLSFHRSNAKVVTEADGRKALIDGKPVADAIAAWASTDDGKHFVAAPASSGGGAGGGAGGGGNGKAKLEKQPVRKDFADETEYFRAAADWADQQAAGAGGG